MEALIKFLSIFLVLASTCFVSSSHGYKFYVGGRDGWVLNPSENYNHWAERSRFQVNDTLYFKYKKGMNSVLVVNKDDYYSCNIDKPILKLEDGDSTFVFDRSGPFFFISGNKSNCDKGQKLIIVVLALSHSHFPPTPISHSPATSPIAPPPTTGKAPAPATSPISPAPAITPPGSSPGKSPVSAPSPVPSVASSSPVPSAPITHPVSAPSPAPLVAAPTPVVSAPTPSSISPSGSVPGAISSPGLSPSSSENTPGGSAPPKGSAPPVVASPSIVLLSLVTLWFFCV